MTNLDPSAAYDLLRVNPAEFLKRYPIRIIGSAPMPSTQTVAMFNRATTESSRPGTFLGTHHMHSTSSFEIRTASNMGDQQFTSPSTSQSLPHRVFPAHFVHMSPGIDSMESYRLPLVGPKLMITPLLTGCSFVMEPAGGGEVRVTHVRPSGTLPGAALPGAIASQVGGAQIYGADDSPSNYDSADRVVTIVGVLTDGGWVIYAQKLVRDAYSDAIVDVYEIYPRRQKL